MPAFKDKILYIRMKLTMLRTKFGEQKEWNLTKRAS